MIRYPRTLIRLPPHWDKIRSGPSMHQTTTPHETAKSMSRHPRDPKWNWKTQNKVRTQVILPLLDSLTKIPAEIQVVLGTIEQNASCAQSNHHERPCKYAATPHPPSQEFPPSSGLFPLTIGNLLGSKKRKPIDWWSGVYLQRERDKGLVSWVALPYPTSTSCVLPIEGSG